MAVRGVMECPAAVITMKRPAAAAAAAAALPRKSERHFEDLTRLSPTTRGSYIINHPPFAGGGPASSTQ